MPGPPSQRASLLPASLWQQLRGAGRPGGGEPGSAWTLRGAGSGVRLLGGEPTCCGRSTAPPGAVRGRLWLPVCPDLTPGPAPHSEPAGRGFQTVPQALARAGVGRAASSPAPPRGVNVTARGLRGQLERGRGLRSSRTPPAAPGFTCLPSLVPFSLSVPPAPPLTPHPCPLPQEPELGRRRPPDHAELHGPHRRPHGLRAELRGGQPLRRQGDRGVSGQSRAPVGVVPFCSGWSTPVPA